jgi:hypothetical protein
MKTILLASLAALVTSSSVFATEYRCSGKEAGAHPSSIETVLVVTATNVKFQDMEGTDQNLPRVPLKNESANAYANYGDYGYDGYGGYVELRLPKSAIATKSSRPFPAYFSQDVYSELGKVGEIRIKLNCAAAR